MIRKPDISFIIIEYHSAYDVTICSAAISEACHGVQYEIIVSSNSLYPVGKQEELRLTVPNAIWLFNERNGGFAEGMNAGLACASGTALVITNPDVRIKSGNIRDALDYLAGHHEVGVIGPRIVDSHGALQDTCRHFMTPVDFVCRVLIRILSGKDVLLEPRIDYTVMQPVDWVIGAFMIINCEAMKKVGSLDEGYFLYVEDMDWCKRFWDNGFKVIYYPSLEVEYKGDRKSTAALFSKKKINKYAFYHLRSYIRFLWKHGINPSRNKNT